MNGQRLKVVVALHLSEPGGPSRSLVPVLERLRDHGDVVTAVPGPGRAAGELARIGRVVVLGHTALTMPHGARGFAASSRAQLSDMRRFGALLRAERADLAIIATTTLPALTLAARLAGVPTIVYAAELPAGNGSRRRAGRALIEVNARLCDVTVACSDTVARHLPASAQRVVVYPAISNIAGEGDAEGLRRRHGIPIGGPVLAMLGNISRERAQHVAVHALERLHRTHPGARLLLVGEPHPRAKDHAYAAELRHLVAARGLGDAVHLCGFEHADDVFAACDVVVNTARSETFGRVAMEALVAGRPVVATAVGAVPEVLIDERHALLVAPDRPDLLAEATARLLADAALRTRLVAEGRRHVLSAFSAERQLPRFDDAIRAALRGRL